MIFHGGTESSRLRWRALPLLTSTLTMPTREPSLSSTKGERYQGTLSTPTWSMIWQCVPTQWTFLLHIINFIARFSATKAMWILSPFHPIRRIALTVFTHPMFGFAIITTILVNCKVMTMPESEWVFCLSPKFVPICDQNISDTLPLLTQFSPQSTLMKLQSKFSAEGSALMTTHSWETHGTGWTSLWSPCLMWLLL